MALNQLCNDYNGIYKLWATENYGKIEYIFFKLV